MKKYFICTLLCTLLFPFSVMAHVSITVEMDSNAILIGQQAHIALKVVTNTGQHVTFPVFPDKQIVPGLEVLNETISDTEKLNEGQQTSVTKTYTITSFDSTLYYIPPFKVRVDDKVYPSESLALKVETMEVDTLHLDQYFGPKEIAEVPFSWKDWRTTFFLSLLLLLLILIYIYIGIQLYNKRPIIRKFRIKPALPPHQWAMNEIERINQEKEYQNDSKEYYTRLTDVLRSYIQRRYGFNAREMTSGEIIEQLTKQQDKGSIEELRQLFQTADLAKFAKLQTLLNENDENLLRAMDFIQATKIEVQDQPTPIIQIAPEVKRGRRSRLALRLTMIILTIACLLIASFIGRSLYYLFF